MWCEGGMAEPRQNTSRLPAETTWRLRNSRSSRKQCLRRLRRCKRRSTASRPRGRSALARGGMCGRQGIRARLQKWWGRQTSSHLVAHKGKGRGRIQEAQVKVACAWAAALDTPAQSLHCFHTVHAHISANHTLRRKPLSSCVHTNLGRPPAEECLLEPSASIPQTALRFTRGA